MLNDSDNLVLGQIPSGFLKKFWLGVGFVAIISGFGAIAADVASGWSAIPDSAMETSVSLHINEVAPLLLVKPPTPLILGHYLALLFIPPPAFWVSVSYLYYLNQQDESGLYHFFSSAPLLTQLELPTISPSVLWLLSSNMVMVP